MKPYHKQSGLNLQSIFRSFKNALRGLKLLFKYEYNLYIEISVAFLVILLAYFFSVTREEWLALIIVVGMVIFAELTNTAIEKIMDFVHPDYHEKVRDIKDLTAGSVVFTVIIAVIIGILIFAPRIISLF